MGLVFRKRVTVGRNAWFNISNRGASETARIGPVTMNSRGRGSVRILPGLSYRFGKRR